MASQQALGLAAQMWCDDRTKATVMDPVLAEVFAEKIDQYVDVLIWSSGSADFAPGGQAHEGWKKTAMPLIQEWTELSPSDDTAPEPPVDHA